ncbi:MAG: M20/M25/M40 family metallo-hydrolase [Gemmatirosa sp.]|nr:M20/M25/M40 family metallo-hydrolase [Gemmatirosa sp.]
MPRTEIIHAALADARARLAARDAEIVRTQVTIAEIPAPTGDEGERGEWVARRFRALGLADVRTDAAGNVIARRPGAVRAAPVVLCAHLDTVFPRDVPLHVRRDGRRLIGPGIGDNGRGLAVMLALAEAIDGDVVRTRRPVEFLASVGEEGLGDLRGAKRYFADEEVPAAVIVVDGAGDERVVHRALGARRFRVTFQGPGGHSWAAFGVPNAVHAAGGCAARLAALELPTVPRATLSVGRIGGGISVNAIPTDAWLEVDVRATDPALLHRLTREVRHAAQSAAAEENARRAGGTPRLTHDVEVIGDRPCGLVPADDPLVCAALAATRLVGRTPELATASTDANVPIGLGVPAVAIGAGGRGGDAHTTGEWFDNTDGTVGVARALTLAAAAAGLA